MLTAESLNNAHFIGLSSIACLILPAASLLFFFLDHLPNNLPIPKDLGQALLLEKLKLIINILY